MNNFHVIMKEITMFDGRRANEFQEWNFKLCASLSVYNKTTFNVLQGQERPSEFDADQETTRAIWDTANKDLYSVLFFTTAGLAFSVVRRFQGKTPTEGEGHGQRRGQPFREKFGGCLRAAIRVEHIRKRSTRMRPSQDPDNDLYHMNNCRGRLNACDPPEGPTDRQYEDIILQVLPLEYDRIRRTLLDRRDFGLADIRRIMVAIYANNLPRSESSKGIAGRGAAMQAVDRERTSVLCHYCDQFRHFKRKYLLRTKRQQQQRQQPVRHHQQQQRGQHQQKPRGRRESNGGGGRGRVWCSYHKTTSHNDADCRVQQHKAGGNAHVAAARTQRVKGVSSVYDLPEEDDESERPYISFTAT